ncbi:MAG: NEAT domain-containing protein [Dethiobacter sp.]|nr:NEAT domain-containing protein [Dethiobacter sp.]
MNIKSFNKFIVGITAILMLLATIGNAVATSAIKDGTYTIEVTALQEKHDLPSQMDNSIIKPATLEVTGGQVFAILTVTGSSNLGRISFQNTAGEFEAAEVVENDNEANTRTVKYPVEDLEKPVMIQTVIIPAGGITVRFRLAFNKESLKQPGDGLPEETEATPIPKPLIPEATGKDIFHSSQMIQFRDPARPGVIIDVIPTQEAFRSALAKGYILLIHPKITPGTTGNDIFHSSQMIQFKDPTRPWVIIDVIPTQEAFREALEKGYILLNTVTVKAMHATDEGTVSSADSNLIKLAQYKVVNGITYVYVTMNRADIMSNLGVINTAGEFTPAEVAAENLRGATSQEKTRTYKIEVASFDDSVLMQTTVDRGAMGVAQVQFRLVFEK